MRSKGFITLLLMLNFSCVQKIEKNDLAHLSGYWEIKEVIFSDGTKKEYPVNLNVDFFQLDDLIGFRKKMKPEINGTYSTTNNTQRFTIQQKNEIFTIYYSNELNEWSEKLIAISKESLIIENNEELQYVYARYYPLNLNP